MPIFTGCVYFHDSWLAGFLMESLSGCFVAGMFCLPRTRFPILNSKSKYTEDVAGNQE